VKALIAALIAISMILLFATVAAAQGQCAPRADAVALLAESYGESVQMTGRDPAGALVQFWANAETGTWSLTVVPAGQPESLCLVSSGRDFALGPMPAAAQGEAL
jgi:hypothetical protein